MEIGERLLHWLARARLGNLVAIALGIGLAVSLAVAVAYASTNAEPAPAVDTVPHGVADLSVTPPSVNLTSNDPGFMTVAPVETTQTLAASEPPTTEPTSPSSTPASVTEQPESPATRPSDTPVPAPVTTEPAAPTSPQADPNIVPLVIAWDGVKCAQAESRYVQTRNGPVLLCPASIQP